ncbi:DUF6143 family protein [Anaeromicropila populeti]|uniref:Uncharacterized protein n=1 Tax=Anaeromicropila populeti TaxID=37658 RepID=A0A1I6J0I2_9FIRM|nr:DUF6143 family protein [Anaeromicropila populeti]SFR72525.1 hypothetical protein SAMN05661086_01322 [Anaeromicropila populeti]
MYNQYCNMAETVDIPIELYKSQQGKYFVGYADNLKFGNGTSAWARLYNPCDSGVNLHVNVWTVSDISTAPFQAQFWFNAVPSGTIQKSAMVTASNTAIQPIPRPEVKIQSASYVTEEPKGGTKAFIRSGQPQTTLVDTENGKFIFPPGGSFLIYLTLEETGSQAASGRVAFGWWEERICN